MLIFKSEMESELEKLDKEGRVYYLTPAENAAVAKELTVGLDEFNQKQRHMQKRANEHLKKIRLA